MRTIRVLLLALPLAILALTTYAAENIAGYRPESSATGTTMEVEFVSENNYRLSVVNPVGVFDEDPQFQGARKEQDPARKGTSVWILESWKESQLFDGATVYAFGLGANWQSRGRNLADVNLSKAMASNVIANGKADLDFRIDPSQGDTYCQPLTWVIVFHDGKRAWGGHPGYPNGPYLGHNKNGAPMTVVCVDKAHQKIIPPDKETLAYLKQKE